MNKAEMMGKLQADNDLDILERLPSKYEDLTPLKDSPFLTDGQPIRGCYSLSNVKTNRANGIIRFDGTNKIDGITHAFLIYNQMFYLNRVATGKTLFVVGRYSKKFKAVLLSGVYELTSKFVQTGIKPVYKLQGGVSQSFFISTIDRILHSSFMYYIGNEVPKKYIEKYKLLPRSKAFIYVHQPNDSAQMNLGLRNFKYEEALKYGLKMEAMKRIRSIYKKNAHMNIDRSKMNEYVLKLPYKLTADQLKVSKEIMDDMDSSNVMFRMLQGDVGTGKTAVAFLALYANVLRGGQGVLLAPTTSLANQHYKNALESFKKIPEVKIGYLVSGLKTSERKKIMEDLACGDINILIATQAGYGKSVEFSNLTLTVIDEQQQFGVNQRMEMIAKGDYVDTLMMSATPIPRTMSRILYGDLELSELKEFPKGIERNVTTKVVQSEDEILDRAVKRALEIKRQIFVVVPRIDGDQDDDSKRISANEVYEEYVKKYSAENVQLLHGRMKKDEQERILNSFRSNEKPILISTSIIEVGVDVQEACLMIIYSANFFGLSALHQMRGRIGRNGKNAMTLLVYDGDDNDAKNKLQFLATHNDGYDISEYDLKTRGAGNWAGTDQSGTDDLVVANFAEDKVIFECAMDDAIEILDHANTDHEFKEYKEKVIRDERLESLLV